MSLLEAMACGVPVAASHACNFPEITSNHAGWECESTAVALAETLNQALSEDDLARQQRGQNGRRLVKERYNWPVIISVLLDACAAHCS